MIKYDRTKNSIRSSITGMLLLTINIMGGFLSRTVLIYVFGVEYVGLGGLFASVLTVLNLADMGFSSAVVYKLYKPIAEDDVEKVCTLINYYKTIYRCLGFVVLVVGLLLVPFLKFFISGDVPGNINIYVLYLIYLLNCCFTYWLFAYKTALLMAHQRNDLSNKVNSYVFFVKYVLQLLVLIIFNNYYVYVVIIPLTTLLSNTGNALIVNRMYPYYKCRGKLSIDERTEIRGKITALMYNKIGVAVITGSDNIVISSFLGLVTLGVYDSYYYIFSTLYSVFNVFHTAITSGVGNSIITESVEANYKLFNKLSFLNAWVVGWASICMVCLYDPFMSWWIDKSFGPLFSLVMAVYFYFWMMRFIVLVFKNAQGLWKEDRFRAVIEGLFNLGMNLIMVQIMGIYGVVISTIIAMVAISVPWETKVLFKYYFKKSTKQYYLKMFPYLITTVLVGFVTYTVCSLLPFTGLIGLALRGGTCIVIPNIMLLIFYYRTEECKSVISIVARLTNIR